LAKKERGLAPYARLGKGVLPNRVRKIGEYIRVEGTMGYGEEFVFHGWKPSSLVFSETASQEPCGTNKVNPFEGKRQVLFQNLVNGFLRKCRAAFLSCSRV